MFDPIRHCGHGQIIPECQRDDCADTNAHHDRIHRWVIDNGGGFKPLTPDQRRLAYYKEMAGSFPGPNRAVIAAMIACRMVELEEQEGDE